MKPVLSFVCTVVESRGGY